MPTADDLTAATATGLTLSGGGALANQRRGFSSWKVTGRWAGDCDDREKYMESESPPRRRAPVVWDGHAGDRIAAALVAGGGPARRPRPTDRPHAAAGVSG